MCGLILSSIRCIGKAFAGISHVYRSLRKCTHFVSTQCSCQLWVRVPGPLASFFCLGSLILPRFLTKVGQTALNPAFKVLSAVYKPSTWRICVSTAISEVCPLYVCQRCVKSAIILISVLRYSLAHLRASNILIVSIQYINSRTSNHLKIFNY